MTFPRHVAIIMDGNGRWAEARGLPRHAGHKSGIAPVKMAVETCGKLGIEALTLFAFSSENWRRPDEEVGRLMELFMEALQTEVAQLHGNGVRLKFIGNLKSFSMRLQTRIAQAEDLTRGNLGLKLFVAMGYGGRWDIVQAARALTRRALSGALTADAIDEEAFEAELSLHDVPDPDLFIRTGGEKRISNFLLWQLAYTELYFCDALWPDFSREQFDAALEFFASRERRFGRTAAQTQVQGSAH